MILKEEIHGLILLNLGVVLYPLLTPLLIAHTKRQAFGGNIVPLCMRHYGG
jgi:hypothetical protein